MFRLLILSIYIITTALADPDKKECEKMFDPRATRCCKKTSELQDKFMKSEDIQECFKVIMDPALCEHDLCVAKKRGFATDDNKLDRKKFEEHITKDLEPDAELMKDIKLNCFNGDLDKYGPPEFCDFFKMRKCFSVQMLKHCPEWNNNDVCNNIKGLVKECGKSMM